MLSYPIYGTFLCWWIIRLSRITAKLCQSIKIISSGSRPWSYFNIGFSYQEGRGVESDTKKAIHYHELGAVKGDVNARFALGMLEGKEGSLEHETLDDCS